MTRFPQKFARALRVLTLATAFAATSAAADAPRRPQRIVSTNLCTDRMLTYLVEPERIVSLTYLSWEAGATPPDFLPALQHIRPNHGLAEEVLMMKPDLVVGGEFSARFSNDLLRRLGKNLHLIKSETSFEDWYAAVRDMGQAVGEPQRAERLIADFKTRLAAMKAEIPPGDMPIYASLAPDNYMSGRDTLYTDLVNAGGFRTVGEVIGFSGMRAVPLEQLIGIDVSLISTNVRASESMSLARASLTHPLLRMMADRALVRIDIPSRYTTCTTPETLNMVRELVDARKRVDRLRAERAAAGAIVSR